MGRKKTGNFAKLCHEKLGGDLTLFEDGFIRSVGLGSSLSRPLSIVSDSRGIYFDPTHESDLEFLLSNHKFDEKTIEEAKEMIELVKKLKISKYNSQDIPVEFAKKPQKK